MGKLKIILLLSLSIGMIGSSCKSKSNDTEGSQSENTSEVEDDDFLDPSIYEEYVTENDFFLKIDSMINDMKNTPWSIKEYNDIHSEISTDLSSLLIDDEEADILQDHLDLVYIPKLVKKTKQFFNGKCYDRGLLSKLNSELRRYRNNRIEKEYRERVAQYRAATSTLYNLAGYTPYKSKTRKGLDGRILRYTKNRSHDSIQSRIYIDSISLLFANPYVRKCTLGKESYRRNHDRLDNQIYKPLVEEINNYVNHSAYADYMTNAYNARIRSYESCAYHSRRDSVNNRVRRMDKKLIAHRKAARD